MHRTGSKDLFLLQHQRPDQQSEKNAGRNTTYATRSSYANAALSCKNGTYQGSGAVQIQLPPGFKPDFQSRKV